LAVSVTAEEAEAVAAFLTGHLASLQPHQRVLLDGSVTDEPDDHRFHSDDLGRNYSATRSWLVQLRDFCLVSGGFDVTA